MPKVNQVNESYELLKAQIGMLAHTNKLVLSLIEENITEESHHRDKSKLIEIMKLLKSLKEVIDNTHAQVQMKHMQLVPKVNKETEVSLLMGNLNMQGEEIIIDETIEIVDEEAMSLEEMEKLSSKIKN